ncbi:MAG: N-acetylmuramoyl-L-alanine amidase [Bacteroidales bacterium]|nr:N-acetylmuramoyl-L-alanine amidase [Bacteroidales bacterium]
MKKFAVATLLALLFVCCFDAAAQTKKELAAWFGTTCDSIVNCIQGSSTMKGKLTVERVAVKDKKLEIHFSRYISDHALRYEDLGRINRIITKTMPDKYKEYRNSFEAYSNGTKLSKLVSRHASGMSPDAAAKSNRFEPEARPLVRNTSRNLSAPKGLTGRHIALWQSHGYYYDQNNATWKWQRPRLFCTCEDLFTQSFVLPYLVPMLENAGAVVMMPRERDIQSRELIVDNDTNGKDGVYSEVSDEYKWKPLSKPGFAHLKEIYYEGENPFTAGTARCVESVEREEAQSLAKWEPEIEQEGEYAVYVSYATTATSTKAARYTVTHNGGETTFLVNQTMGGGTWIYLGTFGFRRGQGGQGVTLTNNTGNEGETVTADAVKFGGGMGNIARSPFPTTEDGKPRKLGYDASSELSGYPRWCEGSRTWLQWAGMVDTVYSISSFADDYHDDYTSRARWVNALLGGTSRNPKEAGYNIPLDLSFAFHSDAGITSNDSIVGTLAIYTKTSENKEKYAHGGDRNIGREYADMIQSQIVSDIQATLEPRWSRRGIWDKSYYESRLPHIPAMLLELLSHQNFADMRYGLDPNFRFVASRAVYKGMLRFLSYINDTDFVVQPLPVRAFAADIVNGQATLTWEPTPDPLEPTAEAESYIVYTRITDPATVGTFRGDPEAGLDGFDNGVAVSSPSYKVKIQPGKIYSFKVAAVNDGGESLCSEILSVGLARGATTADVIVVNNFDRVAAPASFACPDSTFAGFMNDIDGGVPYLRDIAFTGAQYEFRRSADHLNTEPSSFGASYGDWETRAIAGNTFDYPLIHGAAIMAAGSSFVSASRLAVCNGAVDLKKYRICDLICGKQVRTPTGYISTGKTGKNSLKRAISYNVFPEQLRTALADFTKKGGSLLVSGAWVAGDCRDRIYDFDIDAEMLKNEIEPEQKFTESVLHLTWLTGHACHNGGVRTVSSPFRFAAGKQYSYYNQPNAFCYCVESPDGILPDKSSFTVCRYTDSGISAAVAYKGTDYRCLTFGFPLETITSRDDLNALFKESLGFFK